MQDEASDCEEQQQSVDVDALSGLIANSFTHHIGVPAALGTRRTTLLHKLHAILHALHMEVSPDNIRDFASSIASITTDFGVEHHLADVTLDREAATALASNFSGSQFFEDEDLWERSRFRGWGPRLCK